MNSQSFPNENRTRHGMAWPQGTVWSTLTTVIVFAAVFICLQKLTFLLRSPPYERTTLWVPGALTFATMLIVPRHRWWQVLVGLWIGSFSAYYGDRELSGFAALLTAPLHFILVALGVRLIRHSASVAPFSNIRDMVAFLAVAGIAIPLGTAFPMEFFNWLIRPSDVWPRAVRSFLCVSLGLALATPAFYSLGRMLIDRGNRLSPGRMLEAACLGLGLLTINGFVFTASPSTNVIPALVYIPIPFLVWSALRFEATGVSWALLSVAYISTWNAINGRGPFVLPTGDDPVLQLQLFLLAVSLPLFLMAAATTERRHSYDLLLAETQQRQRVEDRFRLVVEAMPAVVLVLDRAGRIQLANRQVKRLVGHCISDLIGAHIQSVFSPSVSAEIDRFITQALKSERGDVPHIVETKAFKVDRSEVPIELTLVGIDPEEEGRVLAILIDQTDRKKAEEARKELLHTSRLVQLSEFTTSIAHEINQPLAAIMSNAETAKLLLDRTPPPLAELRELIQEICNDDRRASEVISRLRALIRKSDPRPCIVDLNTLLKETQALLGFEARRRGVTLNLTIPSEAVQVLADRVHIQQIVLNLLANAIDAAELNRQEKIVELHLEQSSDSAIFSISDTGSGFGTADPEQVFTRFYSTKTNGLGLGLAITRSLVEEYHGTIRATRDRLNRTLFVVELPAMQDAALLK